MRKGGADLCLLVVVDLLQRKDLHLLPPDRVLLLGCPGCLGRLDCQARDRLRVASEQQTGGANARGRTDAFERVFKGGDNGHESVVLVEQAVDMLLCALERTAEKSRRVRVSRSTVDDKRTH